MTGMNAATFWSASFAFDLLNHFIASFVIMVVFAAFDWNHIYIGHLQSISSLFIMLFFFGFAAIPLAYIMSYLSKKPSTGFALLVILYLIFGVILVIVMGTLDALRTFSDTVITKKTFTTCLWFSRLFPIFSMTWGITKLYKIGSYSAACKAMPNATLQALCNMTFTHDTPIVGQFYGCCKNKCSVTDDCYEYKSPFIWGDKGVGEEFLILILDGIIFIVILCLIESNLQRFWYRIKAVINRKRSGSQPSTASLLNLQSATYCFIHNEDSDVVAEKQAVEDLVLRSRNDEAIIVSNLTKVFGNFFTFTAVDGLSFRVHKEECFGLLGVNGAG